VHTGRWLAGLLTSTLLAGLGLAGAQPGGAAAPPREGKTTTAPAAYTRLATPQLPFGGTHIYPGRTLVAYYGTAGTGALGVLGEGTIADMTRRLRRAASHFARPDKPAQIVYELIVTVADGVPGNDGDYSHDISTDKVKTFIAAAHRNKALLVLDLQPGRSNFLKVAKRWAWALKDPWVSLALDPEWRMGAGEVPGQVIGHVDAWEVNKVSGWLGSLTSTTHLPDKLFMMHQFRRGMIRNIGAVTNRRVLAEVQHVDGFGTPSQKLATYHDVARPDLFRMGFKLFYDEDNPRMTATQVLAIRPKVSFVSFQ